MKLIYGFALLALAGLSRSQPIPFYAGNPIVSATGLSCEQSGLVTDARVYEQFTIPVASSYNQIYGNFMITPGYTVTQAYWEIRVGVSPGNGGILIIAGISPVTISLGPTILAGNYPFQPLMGTGMSFKATTKVLVNTGGFVLAPGTYQFTLVPMSGGNVGRCYSLSTNGAGGVGNGVGDGISYYDSSFWGYSWLDAQTAFGGPKDFSLGIG